MNSRRVIALEASHWKRFLVKIMKQAMVLRRWKIFLARMLIIAITRLEYSRLGNWLKPYKKLGKKD